MKINLEEVRKNLAQQKKWNSVLLSEIEFYERGVKLDIPKELVDEFEFTGLNNIDFISTKFYLSNPEDILKIK